MPLIAPEKTIQKQPSEKHGGLFASLSKMASRLFASETVLILLILALVDYAACTFKPLSLVPNLQFIPLEQNPIVSKIPTYFESRKPADLLVLGSSLPMVAIAACDSATKNLPVFDDLSELRKHTKASYMNDLLIQTLAASAVDAQSVTSGSRIDLTSGFATEKQSSPTLFNATSVACMVSDVEQIMHRAINCGIAPKLVIVGVAPRDFFDDSVGPCGETPVFEVLANKRGIDEVLNKKGNFTEKVDYAASTFWYFFRVRGDYRRFLEAVGSELFDRKITLYEASKSKNVCIAGEPELKTAGQNNSAGTKSSTAFSRLSKIFIQEVNPNAELWHVTAKKSIPGELVNYKSRYDSGLTKRFDQEAKCYERMLKELEAHNVKAVFVNMPITKANRALLPPDQYSRYVNVLSSDAAKYGALFVNLDNIAGLDDDADFVDSVHMGPTGGKKWLDALFADPKFQNYIVKALK